MDIAGIIAMHRQRSAGSGGLLDMARALGRATTKVRGADTTLVSSDGASLITTQYEISLAAGEVEVGNVWGEFAALSDQPILGTDAWTKSLGLDGGTPTLLADGESVEVALVAVSVSGTPTLYAIFGDNATTGSEAAPTNAQIQTALRAAGVTGLDPTLHLVVARFSLARATTTITGTHVDPASDDPLKAERLRGWSA